MKPPSRWTDPHCFGNGRPIWTNLLPTETMFGHVCRKFRGKKLLTSVDDKTLVLLHVGLSLFPVICLKSVSQRDTAVSSQKRAKSVLDTDNPYHVACLAMHATKKELQAEHQTNLDTNCEALWVRQQEHSIYAASIGLTVKTKLVLVPSGMH